MKRIVTCDNVSHTPIFFQEVLDILRPKPKQTFLDMTFGTGGHTNLILDGQRSAKVIASDRDSRSIQLAKRMASKHQNGALTAFVSRFSELPTHFSGMGLPPASVDGVIIDTGLSDIQWTDVERGFNPGVDGPLDLRMDPERFPDLTTGSEVLCNIEERGLQKMLRNYGVKRHSRLVADAIIEARYMFHTFATVREVHEILTDALRRRITTTVSNVNLEKSSTDLLRKVVTALRMFVNDEVNELGYAIRIASYYLKPNGLLLGIVHNEAEERILKRELMEVDFNPSLKTKRDLVFPILPWNFLGSYKLSIPDQSLHPRYEGSKMYVASKEREMLTWAGP